MKKLLSALLHIPRDVNDATTSSSSILYIGRQGPNSYDPPIALELDKTYYWRIDEVNNADANSPWKGNIWTFTVANFLVIDDFESYDPYDNFIWYTWSNPNWSGSWIGLGMSPHQPVHSGNNSMEYPYNNTGSVYGAYYSETVYTFDEPQDWTDVEVKIITLFFYGVALTDPEIAYIASDGTGYIPLLSPANLYDTEPQGQKIINFRDFAALMNSWLEKKYWPQ
jgi:hypothetical protein